VFAQSLFLDPALAPKKISLPELKFNRPEGG
jgi:hypothetical protein